MKESKTEKQTQGLKGLLLLKCPNYQKLNIDSKSALSKLQWNFLTEVEKNNFGLVENHKCQINVPSFLTEQPDL